MELEVSPPKLGCSPSDCVSDPEEKEISDDDDDDRNHKHRRRVSQPMERESLEEILTRPYRKRNKPFENGHLHRQGDYQPGGTWKHHNVKFEKKMPGLASFSRAHVDINQKMRMNQSLPTDPGSGRGRGRESGSWSQHDSRFSSVDVMSQMVQQGSVPPSLFAGIAVPNASNAQSASWGTFSLVPGIPNTGLDALHSLSLQGALRPPINLSLNTGIPRQRCRDFEERGFCLRGDMCPMEHGVNRIVIEDVQSLSQFNLPVSLPSAVGIFAGPGPSPAINATSSTLMNNKGLQEKISKPAMADGGSGLVGSAVAGGADFYDPDQPLWTNDCSGTSNVLSSLNPFNVNETESLLDTNPSDRHCVRSYNDSDLECPVRSAGTAVGSQSANLSVWGRIGSSKTQSETKEKIDYTSSLNYTGSEKKEDQESLNCARGAARQGKHINLDDIGSESVHSSLKMKSDTIHNIGKPSQKAFRTLFVNGIPQENNKKEALLSHFKKFGKVIDIYIPLNGERAFVQFSKREEAEAALKAPDAVMGNRFIKLFWANRDSIPDDGITNRSSVPPISHGISSVPLHLSVAKRGNDTRQSLASKGGIAPISVVHVPATDLPVPGVDNGPPKASTPSQKKLDTLELLKEELRKKQEMLDKKRNDFRRQLDKLEKQTAGLKDEVATDQAAKKPKVGVLTDVSKASMTKCNDPGTASPLQRDEVIAENRKCAENVLPYGSETNSSVGLQESSCTIQSIPPMAPLGAPFITSRFKLDNRPTTFKILPPLPTGLADAVILREHFSTFGDLSTIELEDLEQQANSNDSEASKSSACVSFTTRHSAERAFLNGKRWQGHNLQFAWLATSCNSTKDSSSQENSSSVKRPSDADTKFVEESASTACQETAASGNGESDDSEREEKVEMHNEQHENFQFRSTATSCEEQPS